MTAIVFYFDYISPYAYLASTQLPALAARFGREVRAVPVLFAAMLDASGAKGPAEVPLKRDYMFRDVNRLAKMLGVAIEAPATHPFNPLAALRASYAVREAERWKLAEALYRATWVEARRVDQAEVVAAVASEVGFDGPAVVAASQTPEIKNQVRTSTDAAIALGAFGVPTMIVDGELFWGVDSLPLLARYLDEGESLDATRLAKWQAITPSSIRKS